MPSRLPSCICTYVWVVHALTFAGLVSEGKWPTLRSLYVAYALVLYEHSLVDPAREIIIGHSGEAEGLIDRGEGHVSGASGRDGHRLPSAAACVNASCPQRETHASTFSNCAAAAAAVRSSAGDPRSALNASASSAQTCVQSTEQRGSLAVSGSYAHEGVL
jgi:hypothetical protein